MTCLSALAFLIKPVVLFPVLSVFLAASFVSGGLRSKLLSRATFSFLVATILPTLAVYVHGIATGTFLVKEAEKTLLPQLVFSTFFWSNWLGNIGSVVSFPVAVAALLGTALARLAELKVHGLVKFQAARSWRSTNLLRARSS